MPDDSPNFMFPLTSYAAEERPEARRAYAVAAALQIIHTKMASGGGAGGTLEAEMGHLCKYADQIQEALDKFS